MRLPSFLPFRFPKQQVPAHFTPPTESLVIYGEVCASSKLDSTLFEWKRRGWQECALRRQKKSFSSLEVSRIEVGDTALIKLAIQGLRAQVASSR